MAFGGLGAKVARVPLAKLAMYVEEPRENETAGYMKYPLSRYERQETPNKEMNKQSLIRKAPRISTTHPPKINFPV